MTVALLAAPGFKLGVDQRLHQDPFRTPIIREDGPPEAIDELLQPGWP